MSDLIFVAATIAFFAICALYVRWCDSIIGVDDANLDAHADARVDSAP
ncbi:MAG TPA: hypothetical protein VGC84_06260 [Ilumatobacteraceae bacterium]|jgi:hypothetical protein